jgi:DNA-binding transcriptional LysR family regulator
MPFIVPAEGTNYDIGKLFRQENAAPNIRFDVSDDYAAAAMVQKGLGYTILPELMILSQPLPRIRAVPIRNSEREIGIAINAARCPAPAVSAFVGVRAGNVSGKELKSP